MKRQAPTPAELVTFMQAIKLPCELRLDTIRKAIEEWRIWEDYIGLRWQRAEIDSRATDKKFERVPFADARKELANDATLRSYWNAVAGDGAETDWADREQSGFHRYEFDRMKEEQGRRKIEKARKGGVGNREKKAGKKFMKGK